ncbi:hypothetical protein ASPVEDRAFT_25340 [Aspergillus versicolor CBS 583.65]|uniref:Yeast cell wall synthesis Kre9/Knh1-like N-terminal domain-containing protein n=1 Tax=Aspergillus versicolor CBS 583.65 TaxID=1036611 RepID=A0A1L9PAE0_ASPVE|nr:uncharacterized protein ASPVEDRAFT_25340 [Aspergillus versicolor CBS 583.65]OJI98466.1 hypothetical protein ASPVEDRAFT_25340 [Aspergillus versicolor CBS 583.65]
MRFLTSLSLLFAFAVSALALTITTPKEDDDVDFSKPYTVRWRSVPNDSSNFTITLVNTNGHNVNKDVATEVNGDEGEYRIDAVSGVPLGDGYQFNIRSTARNNQGILAQSQRFNVTKVARRTTNDDKNDSDNSTQTSSSDDSTETNAAVGSLGGMVGSSVIAGVVGFAVLLAL